MKIILIAPAKKLEWGEAFWDMQKVCKIAGAKTNSVPLSLLTIAALTPDHHEVEIIDENVRPIDFDISADLIGITSFTSHAPRAYEIADAFRARGVPVVMGGIHASTLPEEALLRCDSVVAGEAELVWTTLLDDLASGRLKKIYRQAEFMDITDSPMPRWDLVDQRDYLTLTIQTSRGCPNNCNFCSVTSFNGRRMRHKSIDQVIEEVKHLRELSSWKTIFFTDDNLLGDKAYARQLLDRLKELSVGWMCQASINRLDDDDMLERMRNAGCRQVFIGFESVSQNSLSYLSKNKVNKPAQYKDVIGRIHAHGMEVYGSFMVGSDGDSTGIYEDTFEFITGCKISSAMVNIVTPNPGTGLFEMLDAQRRITCREWQKYDGEHVCFTPSFTTEGQLLEDRSNLLRKLYNHDEVGKRMRGLWNSIPSARRVRGAGFKERALASLSILLVTPRHWPFIIRGLWGRKRSPIGSVMMAVSFGEYAKKLPSKAHRRRRPSTRRLLQIKSQFLL